MPAKRAAVPTDAFFRELDPESRATAIALRDLVQREAPRLTETMKMGVPHWIGKWYVCYIAVYTDHVNLGFHRGARLKDITGLLEGTGVGLRHVKVKKGAPIPATELAILVRKAVAQDRKSSPKRERTGRG